MKVALTKIGKYLDVTTQNTDVDDIDNLWEELDINIVHDVNKYSKGIISITFDQATGPTFGNFRLGKDISGNFWMDDCVYRKYIIGCEIWQDIYTGNRHSKICYFNGKIHKENWNDGKAIVMHLVSFFNKLIQFENLEDFLAYEDAHNDEEWENKDICDKILELTKVIELYKKYHEINRALAINHEMEVLINNRLKSLVIQT